MAEQLAGPLRDASDEDLPAAGSTPSRPGPEGRPDAELRELPARTAGGCGRGRATRAAALLAVALPSALLVATARPQLLRQVGGLGGFLEAAEKEKVHDEVLDKDGFCKARPLHTPCLLEHRADNAETVKVSLFGNSYSGWYYWSADGLKQTLESLKVDKESAQGLTHKEYHPKLSMHTQFNNGLLHQAATFRETISAESPDVVVLQDGSLIPMGFKGGVRADGTHFGHTAPFRETADAMQAIFGPALWQWAQGHSTRFTQKAVVLLVAPWARPEEAFQKAKHKHGHGEPELDKLKGTWGHRNYEVYKSGVSTHSGSGNYVKVHHEREMLHATLEGLGIYRERLFKGAAYMAGEMDTLDFRLRCPFEVVIVPVGAAFYDIRQRVEPLKPKPRSEPGQHWWHVLNQRGASHDLSAYVTFDAEARKRLPPRGKRRHWYGAKENNFLFADQPSAMPWFGHPSPGGTFLYAAVLKRTILATIQGRSGHDLGYVKLGLVGGHAYRRDNLLIEEANSFDLHRFNEDWKVRSAHVCAREKTLCPGGPPTHDMSPVPLPSPTLPPPPVVPLVTPEPDAPWEPTVPPQIPSRPAPSSRAETKALPGWLYVALVWATVLGVGLMVAHESGLLPSRFDQLVAPLAEVVRKGWTLISAASGTVAAAIQDTPECRPVVAVCMLPCRVLAAGCGWVGEVIWSAKALVKEIVRSCRDPAGLQKQVPRLKEGDGFVVHTEFLALRTVFGSRWIAAGTRGAVVPSETADVATVKFEGYLGLFAVPEAQQHAYLQAAFCPDVARERQRLCDPANSDCQEPGLGMRRGDYDRGQARPVAASLGDGASHESDDALDEDGRWTLAAVVCVAVTFIFAAALSWRIASHGGPSPEQQYSQCYQAQIEDCRASAVCCDPSFACYEKDAFWATCLPSCVAGLHSEDGAEWQTPWSCTRLYPFR